MIKHTLKANAGAFIIPYLSVIKIKAYRYWALTRQRIGLDFNPGGLASMSWNSLKTS